MYTTLHTTVYIPHMQMRPRGSMAVCWRLKVAWSADGCLRSISVAFREQDIQRQDSMKGESKMSGLYILSLGPAGGCAWPFRRFIEGC